MLWTTRLHRSSEEFWSLTYREIFACVDDYFEQQVDEQQIWNIRFGLVCATIRNVQRTTARDKFWQWTDFFTDLREGLRPLSDKLKAETKIRFRQLAALWHAKRDNGN